MTAAASLSVDDHPLLVLHAFWAELPQALEQLSAPAFVENGLQTRAELGISPPGNVGPAVRDLLRHGGFKPSGRSKPASEYLRKAADAGTLGSINPVVDACNVASLHSGLPISVIDLDSASPPFRVGIAGAGARYIFNPSGQEIDVGGLLCLHDAAGPCATAVKDAQRTKTHEGTRRVLGLVWGTRAIPEAHTRATGELFERGLLEVGALVHPLAY